MNYFGLFLFVFSTLSVTAKSPIAGENESISQTFNGPDRTITWRSWQRSPESGFRFRTGDRYLIKVTNGAMTAHKGVWSWHAQEAS